MASNLLPEDRKELEEGHGMNPTLELTNAATETSCVYFTAPNGKTAGMAGVTTEGAIWMLCTPEILKYPHHFAREAKRFVESRKEPLLWNIVDKRNIVHIKLLRFLGFKFLREILHGPKQLSFIEFCRVRSRS